MTGNLSRRMVDFRFSYVDIMVRSARRLDGTGRTGYIYNWKNGHIQMRNHAETGTVTGVSIGINRSCIFVVDADGNRQGIESAKDVIPNLFVVAENREEIGKLTLEITDLSQSFTFRRS